MDSMLSSNDPITKRVPLSEGQGGTDSEQEYFPMRRISIRKMSASKFPPEFKKLVSILVDEVSQIMIYGSRYLEFVWRSDGGTSEGS